uniref:Uncharacterized protein n=1 Tax=Anguilla anguilla TaxID=7936 RepID=A0A0E9QC82_ANGAN
MCEQNCCCTASSLLAKLWFPR